VPEESAETARDDKSTHCKKKVVLTHALFRTVTRVTDV
jgi:hypothetical protein